ncbi:MAG: polymerase beta domain protein region [Chloroflexi bacterium]|nr:polymerase beta domain protein region [Chloroflexota bacterium]
MTRANTAPTIEILRAQRNEILRAASTHGASNVWIFGSVARGEADGRSDVDLLVDMEDRPGGLAYFGRLEDLRRALTDLLGYNVDIMDRAALNRMRERVLGEAVAL